jgi:hypothetical protein
MAYEQVQKPSSSFVPVQKKVSEFAPSASRVQAKDVTAGEQEQIPKVSTPATDANWLMKHPLFKGNQFLQRVVAPASQSESLESEESLAQRETVQRQEEGNETGTPYTLPVQAKLTIGEPGDKYEQEADRVASQVVEQINAPASAQSTQGQSVQRMEEPVERLFDPVAKEWVVPDDMAVWEQFIAGYKKSQGKMKITYADFAASKAKKAEKESASKIPIDIEDDQQLRSLWGSGSVIDKMERVNAIREMFEKSGYKVTNVVESEKTSSKTPPMLFDIVGHPTITKFEIHPGGGIHKAPYIRISTQKGMIKVINSNSKPAYERLTEKGVKYVEVSK